MKRSLVASLLALLLPAPLARADVIIQSQPGFTVTWDGNDGDHFDPTPPLDGSLVPENLALVSAGATPFASGQLGPELSLAYHLTENLNDGLYGNANSWIGGSADPAPYFAGLDLGGGVFAITHVAWGRDNGNGAFDDSDPGTDCCGGQLDDRVLGVYTLQITLAANPGPASTWIDVATFDYVASDDFEPAGAFTAHFRHQYEVATEDGAPILATGVRLLVPATGVDGGTAVDEIEIYGEPSDEEPDPTLSPAEEGGTMAEGNLATAAGSTAFAKDVINGGGFTEHQIAHLNDGMYGNSNSWIGDSEGSFAGISFGTDPVSIQSFAFGRDNGGEGQVFTDRSLGEYTVQITTVPNPDEATPDGDWTTLGIVRYEAANPTQPHLRHRFNFDPIAVTGLRIITPAGAAIDELEVYDRPNNEPPTGPVITPADGFSLSWSGNDGEHFDATPPPDGAIVPDNLALASKGALPLGSSELGPEIGAAYHFISNVNDGFYGNGNSWISASGDGLPFVGVNLGGSFEITSVAWGRDNGNGAVDDSEAGTDACDGQCDDRSLGVYELQVTIVPNPDAETPDSDWVSVGTLDYQQSFDHLVGAEFTTYLRHEYEVANADGSPITATGVRILVPSAGLDGGTAIDEIEVYDASIIPRLRPAEEGGEFAADETNLAADGVPFAKDLINDGAFPAHQIAHLNDGIYGNANSWIGNSENSFAGISLGAVPVAVASIAFGRDNTGGFTDRSLGNYLLQYTTTPDPDEQIPENEWMTIGEIVYEAGSPTGPHLRHRINFDQVEATGIRIIAPGNGLANGAAIDEIEIYAEPLIVIPPPTMPLEIEPEPGFLITWDGNDGDYFDPTSPEEAGAVVPDNLALASHDVTPFGSGELGPELPADFHLILNINDGYYGNNRSWIGGSSDNPAFIGLNFGRSINIARVAWGRDNGNGQWDDSEPGTDACGGQCDDRNGGRYRLQITTVSNPDENTSDGDWVTVGVLNYRLNEDIEPGGGFTKHLRHEYTVSTEEGLPLAATGLRIIVPSSAIAIDEIEVYGPKADPLLAIENGGISASFVGTGMQTLRLGVENEGLAQTLDISGASLEGTDAANFTLISSPDSLEPGTSGEFVIEFDPMGSVGRFLAELRVMSNDEFGPDQTFPVVVSVENANRLVAHYKMDETDADQLVDSSGNQYHGVYRSTGDGSFTLGEAPLASGSAARFAGDLAFAEIPAEAGLPPLQTFSVSMWVHLDAEDADTSSTLFSKGAATGDPFALVANVGLAASPLQFFSGGEPEEPSSEAIQVSTTHHVVAIHVDENGAAVAGATSLRIYVDGVLVLENLSPAGFVDTAPSIFQIGATNGGFGMIGVVDDVQIYQKALSDEERLFLAENPGEVVPGDGVIPTPTPPVAEGVRVVDGGIEISWSGVAGARYSVEFSHTMLPEDWQPLPGAENLSDVSQFVDMTAGGVRKRFYRIGLVSE